MCSNAHACTQSKVIQTYNNSATTATQEAIHLKMFLEEIGLPQGKIRIHEDNEPCIKIAENPVTSNRSKHIDIRYFFVREKVAEGVVELEGINTTDNVADILTKNLERGAFEKHRDTMLGIP